ncbi:MAG: integrase [Peptococcaceae bacterium BRH_c4b]|nr:MAG: integrase [Peptococcaceae bacterium BRH_c4b]
MKKTNDVINYFFKDSEARFAKETARGYGISLRQFFGFCQKEYDEVKAADIRAWLAELEKNGQKARTRNLKLASLRTFYKYCINENLTQKDPTLNVSMCQIDDSLPFFLDKATLALLMEAAKDNLRDRAIIETLYATGVRVSELINTKLSDIKWDNRQIWISKGKGNKERFVLFTTECAERLREYLDNRIVQSPYLFANKKGGHLSRVWVELMFRGYSKKLGLGVAVTPHTLRHTFAAHLAEKDMPQTHIQELLGHVNINTTRIYTRLSATARKKQYDNYQ